MHEVIELLKLSNVNTGKQLGCIQIIALAPVIFSSVSALA